MPGSTSQAWEGTGETSRLAIVAAIGAQCMMLLAGVALAVYACTADAAAPSDYGIGGRIGARAPRFCLG